MKYNFKIIFLAGENWWSVIISSRGQLTISSENTTILRISEVNTINTVQCKVCGG